MFPRASRGSWPQNWYQKRRGNGDQRHGPGLSPGRPRRFGDVLHWPASRSIPSQRCERRRFEEGAFLGSCSRDQVSPCGCNGRQKPQHSHDGGIRRYAPPHPEGRHPHMIHLCTRSKPFLAGSGPFFPPRREGKSTSRSRRPGLHSPVPLSQPSPPSVTNSSSCSSLSPPPPFPTPSSSSSSDPPPLAVANEKRMEP